MTRYRLTLDFDCDDEFPLVDVTGEPAIEEVFDVLPPPEKMRGETSRLRLQKLTEVSN